jgi:hypothetical protein
MVKAKTTGDDFIDTPTFVPPNHKIHGSAEWG